LLYVYANVIGDAIYAFMPWLYSLFINVIGILALIFIILSFIYAIKERNWPVIIFFIFIILLATMPGIIAMIEVII